MNCQQCGKEFISKRSTAKYCGNACRIAHLRAKVSVTEKTPDSVTPVTISSVTADSVTTPLTPFSTKVGTGICHGCGRRIADIAEQWGEGAIDANKEEQAKSICICLPCVKAGITHEKLGLDAANCEKKN